MKNIGLYGEIVFTSEKYNKPELLKLKALKKKTKLKNNSKDIPYYLSTMKLFGKKNLTTVIWHIQSRIPEEIEIVFYFSTLMCTLF